MTTLVPDYVKFSRRKRRLTGSSQVWLSAGEDHLLLVQTAWFVQHYSRFRLRDVQALVVHGRDLALAAHGSAIALTALAAALAFSGVTNPIGRGFLGVFFALILIALAVNLARGGRGTVTIVTSVTRTRLPAITRLNDAREFVVRLAPLIRKAQADLPAPSPQSAAAARRADGVPELPPKSGHTAIAIVLYATVLLGGIISLLSLWRTLPGSIAGLVWELAFAGAAIGAYVAVADNRHAGARLLAALTAVFSLVHLGVYGWSGFSAIMGKNGPPPAGMPQHLRSMPLWFIEYLRVAAPAESMLGIIGLAFTSYFARVREREP